MDSPEPMKPDALEDDLLPDPDTDPQFYAGVLWRRAMAFILDVMIIFGLMIPILALGAVLSVLTFGLFTGAGVLLAAFAGFLYRFGMLVAFGGTAGMLLMGIEVRGRDGELPNAGRAFLHTVGYHVTIFFPPLMLIGWVTAVIGPRKRLLHDLPAGTAVINRPA